jgi:hypothetical protein
MSNFSGTGFKLVKSLAVRMEPEGDEVKESR